VLFAGVDLVCGEVGYITCNIRDAREVSVGDTVTDADSPALTALPGYKKVQPMVFSGIYPANSADFLRLKVREIICKPSRF